MYGHGLQAAQEDFIFDWSWPGVKELVMGKCQKEEKDYSCK